MNQKIYDEGYADGQELQAGEVKRLEEENQSLCEQIAQGAERISDLVAKSSDLAQELDDMRLRAITAEGRLSAAKESILIRDQRYERLTKELNGLRQAIDSHIEGNLTETYRDHVNGRNVAHELYEDIEALRKLIEPKE
ncbi:MULTISPECIES: hypothetical protein [Pseudomonas]|uniref:Uncharacterized protein n=1 Tax=Pseudomonas lutea TaxID=243924 RepID=A0A9X8MH45_9PSED|nr:MULTISPECIES: hypothetical protein [Pseudomonas]SER36833.1 hypothetical protein SAMN05216409_11869 [Pseudomonas lutea]